MDLFQPLDNYCERTGPEFWSEPLNAFSNLAFLVAGAVIIGMARRGALKNEVRRDLEVFGWLVIMVGIGSATFHTVATLWAKVADVLPIAVCLVWFLWSYLRRAAGWSLARVWGWLLVFGAFSGGLAAYKAPTWVNESHQYLGAFLALLLLAGNRPEARRPFGLAALTFGVALGFRTLDPLICGSWPMGTHFLWHSCNGLALYFAAKGYTASALQTSAEIR